MYQNATATLALALLQNLAIRVAENNANRFEAQFEFVVVQTPALTNVRDYQCLHMCSKRRQPSFA